MLLQDKQSGSLVEVLDVQELIMPTKDSVPGQIQGGQEEQNPETYAKNSLVFPSGESLPRCWVDPDYKNAKG